MAAPISVPMQTKIIELYENGSKIKDIAQTVAFGRNAVARIVQAHIDKNAAAPKAIGAADVTNLEVHKLKYLVRRQVSHGDCPNCNALLLFLNSDRQVTCTSCGKVSQLDAQARA